MDRSYAFFAANYMAQGLIGVAYEPISYLLKDALGLCAADSATFAAWMSFPFLIKPLFGVPVDMAARLGRGRSKTLALAALATSACWAALAFLPSYPYRQTLLLLTAVNVGIIVCDVACDAVMVERGRALAKTGRYQAVQLFVLYATMTATGAGGGWVATHLSYRAVFALTAVFPLLIAASAPLAEGGPVPARAPLLPQLAALARSGLFWRVASLIFLWSFNPFRGTAFFYYQNDALRLSKWLIGVLASVGGVAGMAGAAVFGRWHGSRVSLAGKEAILSPGLLARLSVAGWVATGALFFLYRDPASAVAVTAAAGVAEVFFRLALMDAAARACPRGIEASSFAAYMSVFNLSAWASNTAGGWLYSSWSASLGAHGAMAALISFSCLATAACWPLARNLESELR